MARCIMLFFVAIAFSANGQQLSTGTSGLYAGGRGINGPPVSSRDVSAFSTIVNINGTDGYYLQGLYLGTAVTVIDGEKVAGVPYLYNEWLPGTVITDDGRVVDAFPLKYNVYDQSVSFLNGKDSLEITDPVKEFSLKPPVANGNSVAIRFISAKLVNPNARKTEYYDVMIDDAAGILLKSIYKKVKTAENGLLTGSTKGYLDFATTYYFYNKSTKKISKVVPVQGQIVRLLALTEQQQQNLRVASVEFEKETSLNNFFISYFASLKTK
ncbi:MAG: hypothetical protein J7539_11580 [Niabella sp.]|nr:hypothetical protein [Niabella sp.]